MERINIGEFTTLVSLQQVTESIGGQGQYKTTFTEFAKVYAKVERNVDESVVDGNLEAGQSISLTTYKVPQLTTRWRVVVEGKPYEIISIDPISKMSKLMTISLHSIDGQL